jgi:hypothetical protein
VCAAAAAIIFANAGIAQKQQGDQEQKVPRFNVPIPVHQKANGVKIPYWDDDGNLKMIFNIEEMMRKDIDHLQMTNAKIETYDDYGKPDMTVLLPLSLLDLNTRVVTSDRPFILRRTDFDLVGETLELDTARREGKITGKVKMIIYNFSDTAKEQSGHE